MRDRCCPTDRGGGRCTRRPSESLSVPPPKPGLPPPARDARRGGARPSPNHLLGFPAGLVGRRGWTGGGRGTRSRRPTTAVGSPPRPPSPVSGRASCGCCQMSCHPSRRVFGREGPACGSCAAIGRLGVLCSAIPARWLRQAPRDDARLVRTWPKRPESSSVPSIVNRTLGGFHAREVLSQSIQDPAGEGGASHAWLFPQRHPLVATSPANTIVNGHTGAGLTTVIPLVVQTKTDQPLPRTLRVTGVSHW